MTYPSDCLDKYTVRFSPELKGRVEKSAKKNKRSINAEINFLLETALNELAPTAGTVEAGKDTNPIALETCDDKYND